MYVQFKGASSSQYCVEKEVPGEIFLALSLFTFHIIFCKILMKIIILKIIMKNKQEVKVEVTK